MLKLLHDIRPICVSARTSLSARSDVVGMAIGKDPREWIIELGGGLLSLGGIYYSWLLGDLVVFVIAAVLGMAVLQLYRLRKEFSISVRDRR